MPKNTLTPLQRLLAKTKTNPENGCWEWTAHCERHFGYGKFAFGQCTLAHRASWILHNGEIPNGMDVLHKCDNPQCVNPDHLFLGDDFTNQRDRVAKGRHKGVPREQRGEANKSAKITALVVLEIRATYTGKRGEQTAIATRFGVTQSLVSQIVRRKIWRHI